MEKRIGDLLVEFGVVSRDDLESALKSELANVPERLASRLYRTGIIDERTLCRALALRNATPAIVMSASTIDLSLLRLIAYDDALKWGALPIWSDEQRLIVACKDPDPHSLIEQLSFMSDRFVTVYLGLEAAILKTIDRAYRALESGREVFQGPGSAYDEPHAECVKGTQIPDETELERLVSGLVGKSKLNQTSLAKVELKRIAVMPAPSAPQEITRDTPPDAPTIVVAEDDASIREMIRMLFTRDGYHVLEADNGSKAVELIRQHSPDVVILDGQMPGMHGFQICMHLKQSARFKDTPVIAMTAHHKGWERAREVQEKFGADAFLEKPFELQLLRKLVADFIGHTYEKPEVPENHKARIAALFDQVREHALLGEWGPAADIIKRWIELAPLDARAYLVSGNLYSQQRQLPAALRAYETATIYDPTLYEAHTNLALVYERLGFRRKATERWQKAMGLSPSDEARSRIQRYLNRTGGLLRPTNLHS